MDVRQTDDPGGEVPAASETPLINITCVNLIPPLSSPSHIPLRPPLYLPALPLLPPGQRGMKYDLVCRERHKQSNLSELDTYTGVRHREHSLNSLLNGPES